MGLDVVNCTKWTKVVQNTVWSESIGRKRQMATNSASKLPAGTPTDSEHAECGGVTVHDSVPDFSSNWLGAYGISRFFALKPRGFDVRGCHLAVS